MAIKDNPEISQEALENKLKIDLELGKITEQQKKQIANDYQLAIGLANSIPTQDLSMSQFLEAMNLLVKEKKLGGILCENHGGWTVVGIGLNISNNLLLSDAISLSALNYNLDSSIDF